MQPDVSIVIAAYNSARFIERAVRSALAQRDVEVEVIVVDDGSLDSTLEIVRQIGDPRIRTIAMDRNRGPAAARNAGFDVARGAWTCVLDSDDEMEAERLVRMVSRAGSRSAKADGHETGTPQAQIVVDNLRAFHDVPAAGAPLFADRFLRAMPEIDLTTFLNANTVFARGPNLGYMKPLFSTAFLRRHAIRYDEHLKIGEDFLIVAHALAHGARCVVEPSIGYCYRLRDGSISKNLTCEHLGAMILADRRFEEEHDLGLQERKALARRLRKMRNAEAFVSAVDQIKNGALLKGFATVLSRPAALPLFHMPVSVRFHRLIGS